MLWLYLLAAVTVLLIALRRVLRRQKPLDDDLYAKNVAIEYVQTGVAWVRADGAFGSANPAFTRALDITSAELIGQEWYKMFPPEDHNRVQEAYAQMLLTGRTSFTSLGARPDGSAVWLDVRLVAVHDHNLRFVGHHCLIEDRTRERELEQLVSELTGTRSELRELEQPLAAIR